MKKGFTLIELLAVFVVIGIIILVTVPTVTNYTEKRKEDLHKTQVEMVKKAAEGWASKNPINLPKEEGEEITVYLAELKAMELIDNNIKNPLTNEKLFDDMAVIIRREDSNYVYEIDFSSGTGAFSFTVNQPTIILNGPASVNTEINEVYEDLGVVTIDRYGKKSIDYTMSYTSNSVSVPSIDVTRLGNYTVTYSIDYEGTPITVSRTVQVRDTKGPAILHSGDIELRPSAVASFNPTSDVTTRDNSGGAVNLAVSSSVTSVLGIHTVKYTATDSSGNVTVNNRAINVSSNDLPANPTFSQNITVPTNTDVLLTITYSADSVAREYRIEEGPWITYTTPITITSNSTIHARSRNVEWVYSNEVSHNITNIDKIPPIDPTLTPNTTAPINTNVFVTVLYSGDSLTKEYRIGAGAWTAYTGTITVTDNNTVYARGRDEAGNYSNSIALIINNIDKTPPTTPTFLQAPTVPTNGNVTVTITYSGDSNVREYRVGAGAWTTYSTPITVTDNNTVYARGRDLALNYSTEGSISVTNIDRIAPTTPTLVQNPTTPTNGNVTVTITHSVDSNVKQYRIGAGAWTTYSTPITVTDNNIIYARGTDLAGNTSAEGSINVNNIDRTPPANPTFSPNITTPTNGNVTLTINYSGDSTTREYRIGAGAWTNYTVPVVLTDNNTIYARGRDVALNYSSEVSTIINNIDKTAPTTPTLAQSPTTPTNGNVTITITHSGDSNVKQYRIGAGAWTNYTVPVVLTDNNIVYARGTDLAGNNSAEGSINVTNIDKIPPANPTFSPNISTPTNGNVTLTINYSGDSTTREYKIGAGAWTAYGSALVLTANSTIQARGRDAAGNYSGEPTTIINNIDKTVPTVSFGTNGNGAYVRSASTTVTASDVGSGVLASSLRYLWTNSTTAPAEGSFSLSFTNGQAIATPVGTGHHYLWILIRDNAANLSILRTNVFYLDNTPPVITLNGSASVSLNLGGTYTEQSATAYDAIFGATSVTTLGSVNVNSAATYTITYSSTDTAGNSTSSTRTVTVNPVTEYRYRDYVAGSCSTCYDTCYQTCSSTCYQTCYDTCGGGTYACCSGGKTLIGNTCYTVTSSPSGNCEYDGDSTYLCNASSPGTCEQASYQCNPHDCNPYSCGSYQCNPYSCNPTSCNCTASYWGSWSGWSTSWVGASGTREVETRLKYTLP